MTPFPGWKVIPDQLPGRLEPVARGGLVSPSRFLRVAAGPQPYPPPAVPVEPELIWAPEVRVEALQRSSNGVFAEQPTTTQEYQVSAPLHGGPAVRVGERGDLIEAAGRTLRIIREEHGDLLLERVFVCVDNATQQQGKGQP